MYGVESLAKLSKIEKISLIKIATIILAHDFHLIYFAYDVLKVEILMSL